MTVVTRRQEAARPDVPKDSPAVSQFAVEAVRLVAIERRLLRIIQWVVFGGVVLLTVGAGALSWEHLTHIAATNGHIAPRHLLFLFPCLDRRARTAYLVCRRLDRRHRDAQRLP